MKETRTVEFQEMVITQVIENGDLVELQLDSIEGSARLSPQDVSDLIKWLGGVSKITTPTNEVKLEPKRPSGIVNEKDQSVIPGLIDRSKELKSQEVVKFGQVTSTQIGVGVPLEQRKAK